MVEKAKAAMQEDKKGWSYSALVVHKKWDVDWWIPNSTTRFCGVIRTAVSVIHHALTGRKG
jgi:hypothetical protein